jgi:protease-4
MRPDGTARFLSRSNFVASTAPEKQMITSRYFHGEEPSGPVFLMVPATYVDAPPNGTDRRPAPVAAGEGGEHVGA